METLDSRLISMGKVLMGVGIMVPNVLLLCATASSRQLRNACYYFAANLWFTNCLLGSTLAVTNIVANHVSTNENRHSHLVFRQTLNGPEGTVILLDCMVSFATILAQSTARIVWYRNIHCTLSRWSAIKVISSIWVAIVTMSVLKTMAFSLFGNDNTVEGGQCYRCVLGFEAAILLMFATANIPIYLVALWQISSKARSNIHDSSRPPMYVDYQRELRQTATSGLWLMNVVFGFGALCLLLIGGTIAPNGKWTATRFTDNQSSIIVIVYCLHALLNPLIAIARDDHVMRAVKNIICCEHHHSYILPHQTRRPVLPIGTTPPPPNATIDNDDEEQGALNNINEPPPPYDSRRSSTAAHANSI